MFFPKKAAFIPIIDKSDVLLICLLMVCHLSAEGFFSEAVVGGNDYERAAGYLDGCGSADKFVADSSWHIAEYGAVFHIIFKAGNGNALGVSAVGKNRDNALPARA